MVLFQGNMENFLLQQEPSGKNKTSRTYNQCCTQDLLLKRKEGLPPSPHPQVGIANVRPRQLIQNLPSIFLWLPCRLQAITDTRKPTVIYIFKATSDLYTLNCPSVRNYACMIAHRSSEYLSIFFCDLVSQINSKIIEKHHFCLLFGYLNYSIAFCNWEINRFNPKTCVASNQIMHNIVCVYTAVSPPHINIPDW